MAVELRPYQAEAEGPIREALAKHRRIVVVAPTAAGKGIVIAWMAAGAMAKGRRTLIAVPRIELVKQTIAALTRMGIAAGVIASGYVETPEAGVQVCLVSSLVRPQRLARWIEVEPRRS